MTDSLTTEMQSELYSKYQLIKMWNDQADQYNQWDNLSTSEQLDWAQRARASPRQVTRHVQCAEQRHNQPMIV